MLKYFLYYSQLCGLWGYTSQRRKLVTQKESWRSCYYHYHLSSNYSLHIFFILCSGFQNVFVIFWYLIWLYDDCNFWTFNKSLGGFNDLLSKWKSVFIIQDILGVLLICCMHLYCSLMFDPLINVDIMGNIFIRLAYSLDLQKKLQY